jgi:hypothetical protein
MSTQIHWIHWIQRWAVACAVVGLTAGCGSDDAKTGTTAYTNVGETQGGGLVDVSAGDSGAGDVGQDTSGGAVDSGATDTAADSGAADSGAADSGAADSAANDSAANDTTVVDAGKPDVSAGPCFDLIAKFDGIVGKAKACSDEVDCYGPASFVDGQGWAFGTSSKLGCGCQTLYNGNVPETQGLADLVGEYSKLACQDTCPDVDCAGIKTMIGRCTAGQCQVGSATCAEIEGLVKEAIDKGRACTADAECSGFGMNGELPCGCSVNVNLNKMAPGQPIFLYVTKMAQAYVGMGCGKDAECACAKVGPGACVNNVCVTKP